MKHAPQIIGLGLANPKLKITQKEALAFIRNSCSLPKSALLLYAKICANPSIKTRTVALKNLAESLESDPDKVQARFEQNALELSARALKNALRRANVRAQELDFLAGGTCTGYMCPGIAAQLIDRAGLRKDIRYVEVVGMGCGSALPALEQAHNFILANPGSTAATVATEICTAAAAWEPKVDFIVSNAIFADGSAATVLKAGKRLGAPQIRGFLSLTRPDWKDSLRFIHCQGRLQNRLAKDVPEKSGSLVKELTNRFLSSPMVGKKKKIRRWLLHSGGQKVLAAIARELVLSPAQLASAYWVLGRYGNMSSPSVLFCLNKEMQSKPYPEPGELGLLAAFGAGFAAHGCILEF